MYLRKAKFINASSERLLVAPDASSLIMLGLQFAIHMSGVWDDLKTFPLRIAVLRVLGMHVLHTLHHLT